MEDHSEFNLVDRYCTSHRTPPTKCLVPQFEQGVLRLVCETISVFHLTISTKPVFTIFAELIPDHLKAREIWASPNFYCMQCYPDAQQQQRTV